MKRDINPRLRVFKLREFAEKLVFRVWAPSEYRALEEWARIVKGCPGIRILQETEFKDNTLFYKIICSYPDEGWLPFKVLIEPH